MILYLYLPYLTYLTYHTSYSRSEYPKFTSRLGRELIRRGARSYFLIRANYHGLVAIDLPRSETGLTDAPLVNLKTTQPSLKDLHLAIWR